MTQNSVILKSKWINPLSIQKIYDHTQTESDIEGKCLATVHAIDLKYSTVKHLYWFTTVRVNALCGSFVLLVHEL